MPETGSRAKILAKKLATIGIRLAASQPSTCSLLNKIYNHLDWSSKERWHRRYAKMYLEEGLPLSAGLWHVKFLDSTILLPLRPEHAWLDWDNVLSILGAETDLKRTYERLISSRERPDVFVDV